MAPPKPRFGTPCNGCGVCCKGYPCKLGRMVFAQEDGRCPALEWRGSRYVCGLVQNPTKYVAGDATQRSADAAMITGTGLGCDAQLDDETSNRKFEQFLDDNRFATAHLIGAAIARFTR